MASKREPLIDQNDNIQYKSDAIEQSEIQPKCQCICRYWVPRRYCVVLMSFIGLFNVYAMRVNLSVAVEPMSCQFNWDSFTEGIILAAFFGGYLFGNIPGGWLASKFGGRTVFGIGVLATAVLTIILPVCTSGRFTNDNTLTCYCKHESGWCFNKGNFTNDDSTCNSIIDSGDLCNVDSYIWVLITLRFFMGLFESVTFPALYALLNYWTTDEERSRMIGFSFAGCYIGNVLGFPISSFIIASDNSVYGGWPNVFYFFSVLGILWWISWIFFVSDSPFNDPCISGSELAFLRSELPASLTKRYEHKKSYYDSEFDDHFQANDVIKEENDEKINWKAFLTNPTILAIYMAHFSNNWSLYTLIVELPTYLNDELNLDLSKAGFVSVLPYFAQFIVSVIGSVLIDKLIVYNVFNRKNARKIAQTIGTIIPGMLLVVCGYLNNSTHVVILFTTAISLMGFVNSGFNASYGDVSPTLSGVAYGIGNTFATIPGVVSPILSGWILEGKNKKLEWKIIFYIAFFVFCVGTTSFWIWCTADRIEELNKKETIKVVSVEKNIDVTEAVSNAEYSQSKSNSKLIMKHRDFNK